MEGSISTSPSEVCFSRRACSLEEIPKKFESNCFKQQGEQTPQRRFSLDIKDFKPSICQIEDANITTTDAYTVPCGVCERGQGFVAKLEDEESCEVCASNLYSNIASSHKCQTCAAGHYIQRGISLTKFESFPSD